MNTYKIERIIHDGISIGLQDCETIHKYHKIVYLCIVSQSCKPIGIPSCIIFSILYVIILDLNSYGPYDGPIRTETCSPTINKGL